MLQRLAMSSHSLPFAVLQMSWKCELICTKESQNDERYTYCSNGFLNNRTGLFDIVSDYFPTIQLTGAYLGSGPQYHPNMDRFMSILFAGDKMLEERAYQIIGYCISSDYHAKRFFVFPGASGDNGKSTFIHLIRSLLSSSAVKGLSMKKICLAAILQCQRFRRHGSTLALMKAPWNSIQISWLS